MSIHPSPTRGHTGRRVAFVAVVLCAAATVAVYLSRPIPVPALAGPPPADAAHATPTAAVTTAPVPDAPPLEREPAPPPAPPATAAPTFEQMVDRLVELGRRTAQHAQDDEIEAAQTSDREARLVLAELLRRFPDAGERGLAMLAGIVEPSTDPNDVARRIVLQVVLGAELLRRHEVATANDDRSRIDPLVDALLAVMPQSGGTTDVGRRLLDDRPYLRAVHEPGVFALVQLAGEGTFPRDVALRLLATLWDNLQRTGERSSEELARLAMLLLEDTDPTKRAVACRQLLADARFRPLALAWLREHGDTDTAAEIAGLVASDLPPDAALEVLRELGTLLRRAPGAYMVLGARAPELVADAYRELLAANVQPDVRTDLVASVGLTGSEHAAEIVALALQNDPSPEVRLQAAFVLTATGSADAGEAALHRLLDDPAVAGDPTRLGAVVLALHNLEAGSATNQIDRLRQRLRALPLDAASRQSLEALLARSMPGGVTSAPNGGPAGSGEPR